MHARHFNYGRCGGRTKHLKDEQGQDLVEYALVIAVVCLGIISGMNTLASGINAAMNTLSTKLSAAVA